MLTTTGRGRGVCRSFLNSFLYFRLVQKKKTQLFALYLQTINQEITHQLFGRAREAAGSYALTVCVGPARPGRSDGEAGSCLLGVGGAQAPVASVDPARPHDRSGPGLCAAAPGPLF